MYKQDNPKETKQKWPCCEVRPVCPQLLSLDSRGLVRWFKAYEGEPLLLQFIGFLLLHRQYSHEPSGSLGPV